MGQGRASPALDPSHRAYFVPDFSRHQICAETDSRSHRGRGEEADQSSSKGLAASAAANCLMGDCMPESMLPVVVTR
jgi:hypothetical protein